MKNLNNRNLYEIEKERKIKEYISNNKYVPTKQVISFELNNDLNNSDQLTNKFVSGNVIRDEYSSPNSFFETKGKSQVTFFNKIRDTIKNDLIHLYNKTLELDDSLEDSFRNFLHKNSKFTDEYKRLELEINRELITNTDGSMFTYGITEYFDNEDKVIKDETDALIIDGNVTCKARKYLVQNDVNYILYSSSRLRNKAAVNSSDINSVNHILKQDGSYYQHVAYSKNQFDIIDFILDVDLNTMIGIDVKVLRLDMLNVGVKTVASVYTASQPDNWELCFEGLTYINNGTNIFTINKEKVRFIKIVLTKQEADTYIGEDYVYNFVIDYFGLIDTQYETTKDSTLICGPYYVVDENNQPINFNYATIKSGTCCVIPDNTSIEFYLSKDKLNWKHLSFWDQSNSNVSFGESVSDLFSLIDSTSTSFLINNVSSLNPYNLSCKNNEAFLNFYVPLENMQKYKANSSIIKRAIRSSDNGGWFINGNEAECSFFINNFDGIYLDFKEYTVELDQKSVTGKQFISYGEHKIKINNYNSFTDLQISNIQNESDLDSLLVDEKFIRFLIEGFPYRSSFSGTRKYIGVNDNYGCVMKNTDPVYFVNKPNDYKIYTEIVVPGVGVFFKMNVSEQTSEWKNEHFSINALSSDLVSDNKLYIKAVLSTNDPNVSPKIDLIQVRVI